MVLIPDINGKYDDLFVQFLNEPGVLQNLKGNLAIKKILTRFIKSLLVLYLI